MPLQKKVSVAKKEVVAEAPVEEEVVAEAPVEEEVVEKAKPKKAESKKTAAKKAKTVDVKAVVRNLYHPFQNKWVTTQFPVNVEEDSWVTSQIEGGLLKKV